MKDKGNYKYTSTNTLAITTDMANSNPAMVVTKDSLVLRQNDTLKINILINQTIPVKNLKFQWTLLQSAPTLANPPQFLLDSNQNIRAKITELPGLYKVVVKATDKTSGVSFYKSYQLNVTTSIIGGEGWLILQDEGDGSDISLITTRDGTGAHGTIYSNLYAAANNKHKLPVGTNYMAVMNYNATLRLQKVSFGYPNGGLEVNPLDFTVAGFYSDWFFTPPPSPFSLDFNGIVPGGQYECMIASGQVYYRTMNVNTTFKNIANQFNPPFIGTWTLSPFVMQYTAGADYYYTLFDKQNKCFLLLNMQTNALTPTTQPDIANKHFAAYNTTGTTPAITVAAALNPTTGSGFDLNNIGKNLVYAENVQPYASAALNHDAIFRNNGGDSTWVYQVPAYLAYNNNITTGRYFLKSTSVPGINQATIFACPTFLSMPGKFYYVNANSIYTCSVASLATSTAKVGYSFPAGTVIKDMKVFKSTYTSAPATESKVLVVATDETANGNGNNVYFFTISGTGDISNYSDVYKGFSKITKIVFKKQLGS